VLEGQATEPSEVLAELDKVTADDVLRVAGALIREESLRLAVIGPFDDAGRFANLLS
jgi:predicted Zn-dependent peptidase